MCRYEQTQLSVPTTNELIGTKNNLSGTATKNHILKPVSKTTQTKLKYTLIETLKQTYYSQNLPEHKQSSSLWTQKHHTIYPKLVLPSFSHAVQEPISCEWLERGDHGPENFLSLLLLFCLRAKGRNDQIKHVEFRTPKEVRGSKDGTKDRVCAWERTKERKKERKRIEGGGKSEWMGD